MHRTREFQHRVRLLHGYLPKNDSTYSHRLPAIIPRESPCCSLGDAAKKAQRVSTTGTKPTLTQALARPCPPPHFVEEGPEKTLESSAMERPPLHDYQTEMLAVVVVATR